MQDKIFFDCQGLTLEGRLTDLDPFKAAVITHPHPLYGGDMNNLVVETVAKAYHRKGWSTLKFNFRGTGASEGRYDNGDGEQKDIDAAVSWLKSNRFEQIDLAGYSFGAWVLARWSRKNRQHRIRFVAPPVAFLDFSGVEVITGLSQVVVGARDEIAPADQVGRLIRSWQPEAELDIIANADHFFGGHLTTLQQRIEQHVD